MAKFTVDTQLFRELGELLVGRESTALVELIKNAYDADARMVVVEGRNLNGPRGKIVISDNGVGMTQKEFEEGFLRIATRSKSAGNKRSAVFDRRYTGEKGIGRLALHKLARHVDIQSFKWSGELPSNKQLPMAPKGLKASIDWDAVEERETLDELEKTKAVTINELDPSPEQTSAGTRILMTKLRKEWQEKDISKFHDDVATLVPSSVLVENLPESVTSEPLLFSKPKVRDFGAPDAGEFEIELLGDLAYSDSIRSSLAEAADWILEIDCDKNAGRTRYHIAPTPKTLQKYPIAEPLEFETPLPEETPHLSFQARILQISNGVWDKRHQGVRVYMEGFRVLPYGEPTDDWLNLGYDYTNRARGFFGTLGNDFDNIIAADEDERLVVQPNAAYFGGVFLTHEGAPHLKMLVNREGFLPGPAMDFIKNRIRLGMDMLVRVRYATTKEIKRARHREVSRQRKAVQQADLRDQPTAWTVGQSIKDASEAIAQARTAIAAGNIEAAKTALERTGEPLSQAEESFREVASETAMFRVLASIGTELAAFTHEINGLLAMSVGLTRHLDRISQMSALTSEDRKNLRVAREIAQDLRQNLERQAVYLVDITSVDARRRRSRQSIAERFDAASRLIRNAAEKRGIAITNTIDKNLRSPPMFPAELTAIFTNLLTNAVKFCSKNGQIKASADADSESSGVRIRVENTGIRVAVKNSEKWFEPFRSTTTNVDASLGQGMGLGLTITRSILDEYGARISFIEPAPGFDAAIEIFFP